MLWMFNRFNAAPVVTPLFARCNTEAEPAGGAPAAPAEPAPAADETPPAEHIGRLQDENRRLWEQIEQLRSGHEEAQETSRLLEEAMETNDELRRRFSSVALAEAIRSAAVALGIPPQTAGAFLRHFTATVDAGGSVQITPDPTEFLRRKIESDPLLRGHAAKVLKQREADAVVSGLQQIAQADPVDLMRVLDRDARKKAQFIARHGADAYIELAAKARSKGYRG
ncbi:MAG: hypothetical protein ABFD85_11360 [Phycisphaerae bacterium]